MDDYERRNAQEWSMDDDGRARQENPETDEEKDRDLLDTTGSHLVIDGPVRSSMLPEEPSGKGQKGSRWPANVPREMSTPRRIRRPPFPLMYERDNNAKAAWRRRKQNNDTYRLPADYHKVVIRAINGGSSGYLSSAFEEIGIRTGTYIRPPLSIDDRELLLWGGPSQVKAAKTAIDERIIAIRYSILALDRGKGMPSVHSITNKARREYEMCMQDDGRKLRFRQEPETGIKFGVVGAYMWPHDEFQPEQILGPNYEALDPIRMFNGCYIVYSQEASIFKVLSNSLFQVQNAINGIGNVVCEFATRSCALERYFVDLPVISKIQEAVKVIDAPWNDPRCGIVERQPLFTGQQPTRETLVKWEKDLSGLGRDNKTDMRLMSLHCLARMRYYRGRISMRTHFGCFTLNKYLWLPERASSIPVETFVENMRLSDTIGTLNHIVPKAPFDDLFARTCYGTNLFEPVDAHTQKLEDVVPTYEALFTFTQSNNMQLKLRIETGLSVGDETVFEVTYRRWYRENSQKPFPLRFYTVRLDGGTTWRFQISGDNNIEATRLESPLAQFASSVSCTNAEETSGLNSPLIPFFKFVCNPFLQQLIQKTSRKYRLKAHPVYIFEVSRYDTFEARTRRRISTKWGASLFNESWDLVFAENAALRVGAAATWSSSLETFFPPMKHSDKVRLDGGFTDFLENVQSVVTFLNEEIAN